MTTEELSILITIFVSIGINDDHTVDRNTVISIYYNGYYYQNE